MDKKAKKKVEVLNQRIQKLQHQLAGARQQTDEEGEVEAVQAEIDKIRNEIEKLKSS